MKTYCREFTNPATRVSKLYIKECFKFIGHDGMVVGFTTMYAIIAYHAVSSILDQCEVYNIM